MEAKHLQQSLAFRARQYTRNAGLKCVFGASTPKTDGKTVYLPNLPLGEVEQETAILFDRWIIHEANGHGCYTDFSVFDTEPRLRNKLFKGLLNSVEDPRIEVKVVSWLPGTDIALRDGINVMLERDQVRNGTKGPADALQMFVCHWGRVFLLGHDMLEPVMTTARGALVEHIGEKGVRRVEALLSSQFHALSSTQEAIEFTQSILDLIDDIANDKEDDDQKPSEGDSGDGDPKEGDSGESDDSGQGSGSDSGDGDADGSGSDAGDNEDGSEDGASGNGGTDNSDSGDESGGDDSGQSAAGARAILEGEPEDVEPVNFGKALQGALDQEAEATASGTDGDGSGESSQGDGAGGATAHSGFGDEPQPAWDDLDAYDLIHNDLSSTLVTLKTQLQALLSAQHRRRHTRSRRGRLNSRVLHRASAGNPFVYRKRHAEEAPVAAMSVLVDLSYSMVHGCNGSRLTVAHQASLALAEALDGIGSPFEVFGFGGDCRHPAGLVEVKPFGASLSDCRGKLGGFRSNYGGGTPMGEAMLEAGYRLLAENAPARKLLVLTDGVPDDKGYAKTVVRSLEGMDIEVMGVGIQSEYVAELFARYTVVQDLDTLGEAVFGLTRSALLPAA